MKILPITIMQYEPVFRKILWVLEILCMVYVLHPINAIAPITGAFVLTFLILFRPKLELTPLFYGVSFLVFWLLVSAVANYNLFFNKTVSRWLWIFEYYLSFVGCLILLRTKEDFIKLLQCFTGMTLVFGFFGYLELLFTPKLDWLFHLFRADNLHAYFQEFIRVTSTQAWTNVAFAGTIFDLGAFLCLAVALNLFKADRYYSGIFWLGLAVCESVLVFYTFERQPLVLLIFGFIGELIYWTIMNGSKWKIALFTCFLVGTILTGVLSFTPAGNSFKRLQSTVIYHDQTAESIKQDPSSYGRLRLTYMGWVIMLDHPLFGIGLHNFQYIVQNTKKYSDIYPEALPGHYDSKVSSSHNVLTHAGSDAGIPAMIAVTFITFWSGSLLIKYFQVIRATSILSDAAIGVMGMAILVILIVPFDYSLINKAEGMAFFLIWAFLTSFEKIIVEALSKEAIFNE
ncbi:hypothetical protein Ga0466249_000108 [Sporomusaceae bacterium BoRhaA]|uniref:O-antigen ligase family protein n=1 Tax=Pelorhabdus rhamnosifermentans TaxID=2772457 RepID=UPI001C061BFE|nr:O-antigen ligase family protein [Pelorhabdus rhamnosifermentans]MBU2699029.1 hypothetical protein [Pelorhabdus rhamnosifermentans]